MPFTRNSVNGGGGGYQNRRLRFASRERHHLLTIRLGIEIQFFNDIYGNELGINGCSEGLRLQKSHSRT
jgi:hypothetical protein